MEHLDRSALLVLHQYNDHANGLVLKTAASLDEIAFCSSSSPSHNSVQELLTHMALVEFFFLSQCQGKPVSPREKPSTTLSLDEISVTFSQIANQRKYYLENVAQEKLDGSIEVSIGGKPFTLPRWQWIAQSLVHSTHHRGELSIVMTALGQPLPTLDILLQFVKDSGQEWPWE